MQHEHEIRALERGDVCVVDEFFLAYLNYFTLLTPIIQPWGLIFLEIVISYTKLIPDFNVVFHIINGGHF